MLLRLCIPIITMILLKNLVVLGKTADFVLSSFRENYQALACARNDVYRRNLADSFHFLAAQYPYVAEAPYEEETDEELSMDCKAASFSVFRESNPQLPWIYPNWLYRETAR